MIVMNRHVSVSSEALLKWWRYCFTYITCEPSTHILSFMFYAIETKTVQLQFGFKLNSENKGEKKYWLVVFFFILFRKHCFLAIILVVTVVVSRLFHLFLMYKKYKSRYHFCFALSSSLMWKSTFSLEASIESSELNFLSWRLLFIGAQWFDEIQPKTRCQFDFGLTPVANFKHAYDKRQISNIKSDSNRIH